MPKPLPCIKQQLSDVRLFFICVISKFYSNCQTSLFAPKFSSLNNIKSKEYVKDLGLTKQLSIMSADLAPLGPNPDSKVHGAYMGPTWGQQNPGGPHVDPMSLAIFEDMPSISLAKLRLLDRSLKNQIHNVINIFTNKKLTAISLTITITFYPIIPAFYNGKKNILQNDIFCLRCTNVLYVGYEALDAQYLHIYFPYQAVIRQFHHNSSWDVTYSFCP